MIDIKKILLGAVMLWACSCVEPFENITESSLKILVIDGILTNEDIQQKIKIQTTIHQNETVYESEIPNLKVQLIVNRKENIDFINQGNGNYSLPESFRAKTGNLYQLKFQKTDGTSYESNEQLMLSTIPIDKVYDEFDVNGIEKDLKKIPANNIYLDFTDPIDQQNYYLWIWTSWERQNVCLSAYNSDYYCRENCWEIFHNDDWNILSDTYSNGKTILGKLITQIPYYQTNGALIDIKQFGINQETYRFLKLINDQTKRTGTLVDTPPTAIVGNVKNLTNPSEQITGYFMVASASTVEYWLDRKNAEGKVAPVGLLGRKPNPPPNNATYSCIEGPNRTPTKPRFWVD